MSHTAPSLGRVLNAGMQTLADRTLVRLSHLATNSPCDSPPRPDVSAVHHHTTNSISTAKEEYDAVQNQFASSRSARKSPCHSIPRIVPLCLHESNQGMFRDSLRPLERRINGVMKLQPGVGFRSLGEREASDESPERAARCAMGGRSPEYVLVTLSLGYALMAAITNRRRGEILDRRISTHPVAIRASHSFLSVDQRIDNERVESSDDIDRTRIIDRRTTPGRQRRAECPVTDLPSGRRAGDSGSHFPFVRRFALFSPRYTLLADSRLRRSPSNATATSRQDSPASLPDSADEREGERNESIDCDTWDRRAG